MPHGWPPYSSSYSKSVIDSIPSSSPFSPRLTFRVSLLRLGPPVLISLMISTGVGSTMLTTWAGSTTLVTSAGGTSPLFSLVIGVGPTLTTGGGGPGGVVVTFFFTTAHLTGPSSDASSTDLLLPLMDSRHTAHASSGSSRPSSASAFTTWRMA